MASHTREPERLRTRFGDKYTDKRLIADLTSTKRGSADRRVALEAVADRSINLSSAEELKNLRRTLQSTDEGKLAFNELSAQSLKDIRDKATSGVGKDERGNPLVSPAKLMQEINKLDKSGKLDILFGKKGAEDLRTISEVARDVFVSQPGSVNYSNTASQLATLLDAAMLPISYATTGLPHDGLSYWRQSGKQESKRAKN